MKNLDLKMLSDEELDVHRQEVQAEVRRRREMEQIPGQIALLKAKYLELGGKQNAIDAAEADQRAGELDGLPITARLR